MRHETVNRSIQIYIGGYMEDNAEQSEIRFVVEEVDDVWRIRFEASSDGALSVLSDGKMWLQLKTEATQVDAFELVEYLNQNVECLAYIDGNI
jgi:hypothetical protein